MFLRSYNRSSLSPAAILKSLIKVIILITCFGALKKSNKYGMNYLSAKFGTFRQMWTIKSILIPKGPDYSLFGEWLSQMGLLPDTENCWLRMRRECRERFPRHRLQRKPLVSDPGACQNLR